MADWTKSMQQTFEYYTVDPGTWMDVKKLQNVKSCTISRDSEAETLGSATIDIEESLGECYIRIYLVTIQNGVRERHPLGTYLVQTPSTSFDGKRQSVSMDAYTPLIELKEKKPVLGMYIPKYEEADDSTHTDIMTMASGYVDKYARAPVVKIESKNVNLNYNFVASPEDTWLTFLTDLIANAKYTFALDEMGRILFAPKQDTASLQPVWTYNDDNSSILYSDITVNRDLYGIPNVVEVVYSKSGDTYYSGKIRVVNDDPNSPISTVNRGREIVHRVTDPELPSISAIGSIAEMQLTEYANVLLKELSVLEYTLSYSHGYCPVRIGDCVRLNYAKAGLTDIKAKVISQSIKCEEGCPVSEKAVFTTKLWG